MALSLNDTFYVGLWLIHPTLNRVSRSGKVVQVEPKIMQVLLSLAEHHGKVVTKDELIGTVWSESVVTDDVLARAISELRKIFEDDPRKPEVIETIWKTGYRLIAPVSARDPSVNPGVLQREAYAPAKTAPRETHLAARTTLLNVWQGRLSYLLSLVLFFAGGLAWLALERSPPSSLQPSETRLLTSYRGEETDPAMSPDGSRVAFSWAGLNQDNWDIYIKLIGTETPLRVTENSAQDRSPAWSRDGRQIAFIRQAPGECGIYVVSVLGGDERKFADCTGNVYADLTWSPDGKWLAFSSKTRPDDAFSIIVLSVESLEKRKLTVPAASYWGDYDPAFSSDGQTLAFARAFSEGMQDLYTVPITGGPEKRITYYKRNLWGHTWMPGDERLLFASDRGGTFDLWEIPATGGVATAVLTDNLYLLNPSFNRRGDLVYEVRSLDTDIWMLQNTLELGQVATAEPLIASTQWDLHPNISPDGRKIAFTSNRSGSYEIWRVDIDGANPVLLTAFGGPFTGTPRWSPDGQHIAFDSRLGGHGDLYVIDAEGGLPRRLTMVPSDDLAPSWSQDGRWIYFASSRSGTWQVWKMPAEGGKAVQITRDGGFGAHESSDGAWLYFSKKQTPGLWQMPTAGGEATLVLETVETNDWGNWAIVTEGLYVIQRMPTTPRATLTFFSFATREVTLVFTPEYPVPRADPALAVSVDGQQILLGQTSRSESDLMLLDGFR